MIPAHYSLEHLDKSKKLFEDIGIIKPGFVQVLKPKLKIYDKFKTEKSERLMNLCRSSRNSITQIRQIVDLDKP